jgi:hypothetical protein
MKYKSINISFGLIPIFWTVLQKWFRTLLSTCLSKINPRFSFVKGSTSDDKDNICSDVLSPLTKFPLRISGDLTG